MNILKTILSAALLALCASPSAFADQFIPANNGNITYTGRIDFSNPLSPRFTYPGVSAALNFEGTTLKMKAKPGSGYFMVEIDDRHPFKINFTETDTVLTLVNSLEPSAHTARISYAVEGYNYNPDSSAIPLLAAMASKEKTARKTFLSVLKTISIPMPH